MKKEFARMKERSIEEATNEANAARANALKEILPMADNYARAKAIYQPTSSEKQDQILDVYDEVFAKFASVIEGFGLERVQALGQPFDYNFMEAVMSMPSTEYKEGIVSVEYQVGYKMGDKSIRPAMVVVSTGPGPA